MGIQNYLKRVSTATKNIKSAIEEKGVPVSQCDGLEVLADKVRQIQTGGSQMFMMLAFKQSETTPAVPTGGYFSDENITYPTGWSDGAGLTENIWMSYAIINSDGSFYKDWVSPIKISSKGSSTGQEIDLTDYALKSWVSAEIAKISTGGSIDLSNYYTKSEIDSKISNIEISSGVASINDITGKVVLKGSSTVNIAQAGNTLTFTSVGGSTGGDVYITCSLYATSSSRTVAPEIPSANTTWDSETKSLINTPLGWKKQVVVTTTAPHVWQITGTFSTVTGTQIGSWEGPNIFSGQKGEPGTEGGDGKDGSSIEYVYATVNTKYDESKVSVDNRSADAADAKITDGYLPVFVFDKERVNTTATPVSVSEKMMYQWWSQRTKAKGATEWSDFTKPVLYNNYTIADVTTTVKEELTKIATDIATKAVGDATEEIDASRKDIDAMQEALGAVTDGETKKYRKLETLDGINSAVGDVTNLGGDILTGDTIISNLSTIKQTSDQISMRVSKQETNYGILNDKVTSLNATADELSATVNSLEQNLTDGSGNLLTAGTIVTKDLLDQYVVNTDFNDLKEGYTRLSAEVSNFGNASGKYLIKTITDPISNKEATAYVTAEGHYIYAEDTEMQDEESKKDLGYGNVFYYAPDKVWVPFENADDATQVNFYKEANDVKEGVIFVEVKPSETPGHLIGNLKTNYATSGTDPDTGEEITAEKIKANDKLNKANATRNAREIAEYAVLIIDTVANLQTKITDNSAEVALEAFAKDGKLASFVLGSYEDGEGSRTFAEMMVEQLHIDGEVTAKALNAEGEDDSGNTYTVNIGPYQDASSSSLYFAVPEETGGNTSRKNQELRLTREFKFTIPTDGYTVKIGDISTSNKLHLVTTGTVDSPTNFYTIKKVGGANIYTSDTYYSVESGSDYSKSETYSGTASGKNYWVSCNMPGTSLTLNAGEYILTTSETLHLLGANMLYATQYSYKFAKTTIIASKGSAGQNGVFLGGNGLKIKSTAEPSEEVVSEVSLNNDGVVKGITSAGIVISPTINKIVTASALPDDPKDNTLYIILA